MDLSTVRLVATDMDGTLLNSKEEVSDRFFELFKELQALDVTFVAASGRQYYSIIKKLAAIKDDIIVIAENGALTKQQDTMIQTTTFDQDTYLELLSLTKGLKDAKVILCGLERAYVEDHGPDFIDLFSEYFERYEIVADLAEVTQDQYLKIAICHEEGSEQHLYPKLKHLEDRFKVKVSGNIWLDISHPTVDKGNALRHVQQKLGITEAETMVFGDYNNDLEMMGAASFSFAMANAHPNILKAARYQTKSNDEMGVEYQLEQLIAAKKK